MNGLSLKPRKKKKMLNKRKKKRLKDNNKKRPRNESYDYSDVCLLNYFI